MNSDTKSQLVDGMCDVWSADPFTPNLSKIKVVAVVHGHCYLLQTFKCDVKSKGNISSTESFKKMRRQFRKLKYQPCTQTRKNPIEESFSIVPMLKIRVPILDVSEAQRGTNSS